MKEVILYALGKLKYKELCPYKKCSTKDILVGRICFSADHNAYSYYRFFFVKVTLQHLNLWIVLTDK